MLKPIARLLLLIAPAAALAANPVAVLYHAIVGRQNHDLESAEEACSFFRNKRAQ